MNIDIFRKVLFHILITICKVDSGSWTSYTIYKKTQHKIGYRKVITSTYGFFRILNICNILRNTNPNYVCTAKMYPDQLHTPDSVSLAVLHSGLTFPIHM